MPKTYENSFSSIRDGVFPCIYWFDYELVRGNIFFLPSNNQRNKQQKHSKSTQVELKTRNTKCKIVFANFFGLLTVALPDSVKCQNLIKGFLSFVCVRMKRLIARHALRQRPDGSFSCFVLMTGDQNRWDDLSTKETNKHSQKFLLES